MKDEIVSAAHPVQGLVCVHGYSNTRERLVPVRGVFLALDAFHATVAVRLSPHPSAATRIAVEADRTLDASEIVRIRAFVDRLSTELEFPPIGRIRIGHSMVDGSGLGSSAAVFAAITRSLVECSDSAQPNANYSHGALARLGSYSAAASYLGGLSCIPPSGEPQILELPREWDFRSLIFQVSPRRKLNPKRSVRLHEDVPSSPFYESWLSEVDQTNEEVGEALRLSDFGRFGNAVEGHINNNLAVAMTGISRNLVWEAETLATLHALYDLREASGLEFFVSVNSGPSVFAFGSSDTIEELHRRSATTPSLLNPIWSGVGVGASLVPGIDHG